MRLDLSLRSAAAVEKRVRGAPTALSDYILASPPVKNILQLIHDFPDTDHEFPRHASPQAPTLAVGPRGPLRQDAARQSGGQPGREGWSRQGLIGWRWPQAVRAGGRPASALRPEPEAVGLNRSARS